MTVCAAIRHVTEDGKVLVVIGSDSEVTISANSERLVGLVGDRKFFRIGEAIIAIAGCSSLAEVLEILQEDETFNPDWRTKKGIREFAAYFFDLLAELAELSISPSDVTSSVDPLLIATPTNIWAIFTDLGIMQFEESYCIGSGWAMAQAVIYDRMQELKDLGDFIRFEDLEFILERALEVSSVFTQGCGGKIITTRVEELPEEKKKVKPPKSKKKGRKKEIPTYLV